MWGMCVILTLTLFLAVDNQQWITNKKNDTKFRKQNHARRSRFLSVMLIGSKVTSRSCIPMLIGSKVTSRSCIPMLIGSKVTSRSCIPMLIGSKVTPRSCIAIMIGSKVTSFFCYLYRFAITTRSNLVELEGCEDLLNCEDWLKNIITANDKWISFPSEKFWHSCGMHLPCSFPAAKTRLLQVCWLCSTGHCRCQC